jgi:hypothetical protein
VLHERHDRAGMLEFRATRVARLNVFPEGKHGEPLVPVEEEVDFVGLEMRVLHRGLFRGYGACHL